MMTADILAVTARRLMAMQGPDGLWGAFRLRPGESREWIGAVAGFALAEAAASGRLPPALAASARACAGRAACALRARERPGGGWGYDASVPPDSDSTAAALRLFAALGQDAPASVVFLAAQGNPTDGWSTYGPMRSWDHWSLPCPEVDGACALALSAAGAVDRDELATLWRKRLALGQDAGGHWRAYWWPGPGVATLAAIEVWVAAGRPAPYPRLPDPATPDMSALDAVTLAQARGLLDPAEGLSALAEACVRMDRPGQWPADAVLLAPPRHPASPPGDSSLEGRGVMTTAAALRALMALPACQAPRSIRRPVPPVAQGLGTLAETLGLSRQAAHLARRAGATLLNPLLAPPVPWPNKAVSSLARGWPVEFSATLDPDLRPALRLACDLGDPRLSAPGRAWVARASLVRAARKLEMDPQPLRSGLAPLIASAHQCDPGERFLIWGGMDLMDGPQEPQPILKAYANLALAGRDPADRLKLAARIVAAAGGTDVGADLLALNAALGAGHPQQMGLALTAQGLAGAKVYWELPHYDAAAVARMAVAVGLTNLPDTFTPEIPGIASHASALRVLSGLAVHIHPVRGLAPELTLAVQAPQGVTWRDAHEAASIAAWAAGMGLSAKPALALMAALRSEGPAPRSLHTLTLRADGRLRAAVYFHADGWLGRHLTRPASPKPLSQPIPMPPRHPGPAPLQGGLS
ncbi:hypothetical protein RAH32_02520 [Paracoccus sp. WLY502]|uniref:hypothetical protein n=1 Tax=Paracoccus yibinensis TaxID=3068891 RepID=UPI0027969C5C|nr:hypothetical protein [Paracoccus sp. WLY502]MDQ1899319.1 hypothetical protein [Paracoccus sp. WLY502]